MRYSLNLLSEVAPHDFHYYLLDYQPDFFIFEWMSTRCEARLHSLSLISAFRLRGGFSPDGPLICIRSSFVPFNFSISRLCVRVRAHLLSCLCVSAGKNKTQQWLHSVEPPRPPNSWFFWVCSLRYSITLAASPTVRTEALMQVFMNKQTREIKLFCTQGVSEHQWAVSLSSYRKTILQKRLRTDMDWQICR